LTPLRGSCQDQARNHPACGHIVAAAQAQLAATCLPEGLAPFTEHARKAGRGLLDAPVLVPMANPGSTF